MSKLSYHWPIFDKVLCGSMSDRERLGLPEHYVAGRFDADYSSIYEQLRTQSVVDLAIVCEQTDASLLRRLVAGNLLALLGDPRIDPSAPAMIPVTGGEVAIGLAQSEVSSVLKDFSGLGLDESWIAKECPCHTVHLADYALAKYPVTNLEYRTFSLETGFAELPSSWAFRRYPQERANHPVYSVSAEVADTYCRWLAKKTGRAFRLPTEAEWEYAAAGPKGYEFPWGNQFHPDYANTAETGLFNTTPVGIFVEGYATFGHADMAGNVEEYVADNYAAYPGGDWVKDHLVEIHGTYRVARGGGFSRFRDLARTRRRHGHNPRSATYAMGFRLAETLTTTPR